MTDKPPTAPPTSDQKPRTTTSKPAYISGGQVLDAPPLTARLSRFVDDTYNFFGLYLTSLFSLDPFTAAQNSQFNTRGPGRTSNQARGRWGAGAAGPSGSGVGSGPRGGGGGGAGGPGGRRLGTVDDVRGPECGSCG